MLTSANHNALELMARVTEMVGHLPAVATIDWCDRAADLLASLVEPAYAVVLVAQVSPEGDLSKHEASGAAIPRGSTGTHAGRSLVATLRSAGEQLRNIGFRPGEDGRKRGICGTAAALNAGRGWRTSPASGVWSSLSPTDLMFGLYPLCARHSGRCLVIQIATMSQEPGSADRRIPVLATLLPVLGRRAVTALGDGPCSEHRWLTSREQQVLEQLTLGQSVREIAETLGRSPHTVHDHVKSLHRKLNASSRGELVARALGHAEHRIDLHDEPVLVPATRSELRAAPEPEAAPRIVTHRAMPLSRPN